MPQNKAQSIVTKAQRGNKEIRSCALGLLGAQLVDIVTTARSAFAAAGITEALHQSPTISKVQMAVEAVAPRKAKGDTYKCAKIHMSQCAGLT